MIDAPEIIAPVPGPVRRADLGSHAIAWAEAGQGHPVILLHGGLMDHQSWGNQLPLAEKFRLIMPDTRGHGQSGGADLPATYRAFADDVVQLMDALGIDRAAIVGFSDGGCAALHMALGHPARLSHLAVIGTPYHLSAYNPSVVDHFRRMQPADMDNARPLVTEVVRKLRRHMTEADWLAYWQRIVHGLWLNEPDMSLADCATISAPTLILHGEHEASVSLEASRDLAAAIPDGRLVIVPGATHSAAQDRPDVVNVEIARLLAQ